MTEPPFDKLRTGLRPPAFAYSISSSCQRFENDLIPARSWLAPSQTANAPFAAPLQRRREDALPGAVQPAAAGLAEAFGRLLGGAGAPGDEVLGIVLLGHAGAPVPGVHGGVGAAHAFQRSFEVKGKEDASRVGEHRTVAVVAVLGGVGPLQPEGDVLAVVGGLHLEEADGSRRLSRPGGANVPRRLLVEGGPAQGHLLRRHLGPLLGGRVQQSAGRQLQLHCFHRASLPLALVTSTRIERSTWTGCHWSGQYFRWP